MTKDTELQGLLAAEDTRQRETLNLIASENCAPWGIREIGSSRLANKYTEGYPGKRYYGGCSVFDKIESLAQMRACELWGAAWANVQPHSGAQANNAVFQALLQPGDKILGLALDHGGHLTHGMKLNVSGTFYQAWSYRTRDLAVDMDEVRQMALEIRPRLIIAGWSAYTDTMDFSLWREIADEAGSLLLVDMSHFAGLVAGGAYPNPLPWADVVTSTTHKTLRGPRGGIILGRGEWEAEVRRAVFPGQQGGAMPQTIAAKALAFHIASLPSWKDYARQMVGNAAVLADALEEQGAAVLSRRKTHQVLLDIQGSGREAEEALEQQGIVVNRNTIPNDPRSPLDPSGIRLGSPSLTSRGLSEEGFREVARLLHGALEGSDMRSRVRELARSLPLP